MYAGRYKNRYIGRANRPAGRGKRHGYGGHTQVGEGSGRHLVPLLRSPRISGFEKQLDRCGMPVQRFRQFRSEERLNVTPASGKCHWYGVPEYMDFGTSMNLTSFAGGEDDSQKYVIKQTPNTCDLFDIYKNINSGISSNTVDYGHDSRNPILIGHRPGVEFVFDEYGTQGTSGINGAGVALYKLAPMAYRTSRPGLDYTMRTQITYDNVSSLDAFVEVYCMEYRRPKSTMGDKFGLYLGDDYGQAELCDNHALEKGPWQWRYGNIHPGIEYLPLPEPVSVPTVAQQRYQGANFAGCMLKAYAYTCMYQRMPMFINRLTALDAIVDTVDLGPAREEDVINSQGRGSMINPELPEQIVCHPKTDPLRVTPPSRPASKIGFKFTRIKAAQRVKPGDSVRFNIPSHGTRHWDYMDSHVGSQEHTQVLKFTGVEGEHTEVNHAKIYYFRVWGDMIHSKVDRAAGQETDFQTGSTSVTFHTQRVCWARSKIRYNTVQNPVLMPFDSDVPLAQQEQFNVDAGVPQIVVNMGDDTI